MFDNAAASALLAEGRCACAGCPGTLTDATRSPGGWSFCRRCRCAWKVSEIDGRQYATAIHSGKHEPQAPDKRP